MESGAILIYLADKTGKLLPKEGEGRYRVIEWLMWQMGGTGPMLGQAHHFLKYNPGKAPYAEERYLKEAHRLYGVLDRRLAGREFVAGDYSIADIAIWPWISRFEWQTVDLKQVSQREALVPRDRRAARRAEGLQGAEGCGAGPDAVSDHSIATISASEFPACTTSPALRPASARATGDAYDERAVRRVGFILSNNSPGLAAAVLALDGHGRAEMHRRVIGRRRNELRAGAALLPIVKLTR